MSSEPDWSADEDELHAQFDEAVFGLIAKGYLEIVPGENGEEDSYRLTPAGLIMGEAITHERDRAHPGMWGA